jgi:DNA topoisomerase-3
MTGGIEMRLVISEKPSVGRGIASVLGAAKKFNGYFEGGGYIVSWCAGHLLELAAPDAYGGQYAKWRYADLPIVPDKWKHTASKDKAAQLKILKDLISRSDVDCVINACDAGREGELIFRLVFEYAKCKKPIKRLWISSMEDAAIKAGFDNIKDGAEYDSLYAAASCRERADWLVGLNATRVFSVLYGVTLNTGRVQSPTLAMLVKREADISVFVKEPYYTPLIDLGAFTASGERLKERDAAEVVRAACDGKNAVVQLVERQNKTAAPPKLFDLTALQRDANRLLGFTAHQTLDYAQSLYEKKLLTYPRTDARYITGDMRGTAGAIAERLLSDKRFSSGAAFTPDIDRLIDDRKVTDHHAIIPTAESINADLSALSAGERDILNLITVRLLCAAAPVHRYEAVTAVIACAGNSFTAKGKTVTDDGWKAVDNMLRASIKGKPGAEEPSGDGEDAALPVLSKSQTFNSVTAALKDGATAPPKHFTEDTLLSAMENAGAEDMPEEAERKGLGTPATRAAVIEKLIKSAFVERNKRNLIPTDKGKTLIAVLPESLKSPALTAEWENRLLEVQRGKLSGEEFMEGITAFTRMIVTQNNAPKPEYAALFGNNGKKSASEPLGLCPRCGAAIREAQKGFFCDTHSCGFKIYKESKFWTAKKKPLTAAIVAALLKDGRITLKNLHSEKTGKNYDATVILDDTGDGYVNFRLEFNKGK